MSTSGSNPGGRPGVRRADTNSYNVEVEYGAGRTRCGQELADTLKEPFSLQPDLETSVED